MLAMEQGRATAPHPYFNSHETDSIKKYSLGTGQVTTVVSGVKNTSGLAFDGSGNLYFGRSVWGMATSAGGWKTDLMSLSPGGTLRTVYEGPDHWYGTLDLAVEPTRTTWYRKDVPAHWVAQDHWTQSEGSWASKPYAKSHVDAFLAYLADNQAMLDHGVAPELVDADVTNANYAALQANGTITLSQKGSMLTALAMAVDGFWGMPSKNPRELYDEIGGDMAFNTIRPKGTDPLSPYGVEFSAAGVPRFTSGIGLRLTEVVRALPYAMIRPITKAGLGTALEELRWGQQMLLAIHGGGHWVLASESELDELSGQWSVEIRDPGRSMRSGRYTIDCLLGSEADGGANAATGHSISPRPLDTKPVAVVEASCPIHYVITSPSGKRLGYDPFTGTAYDEIGGSSYSQTYPILDPDSVYTKEELLALDPSPLASLGTLEQGDYLLTVFGVGDGEFDVDFTWWGEDGVMRDMAISGIAEEGQMQTITVPVDLVVPEPAVLSLLVLGGMAMLRRRRR